MAIIALADMRKNLASYLDQIRYKKRPLIFGSRYKKEFILFPYPNIEKDDDELFEIYESLEDKLIQSEYYTWLETTMNDRWNEDNDDLFE